MAALSVVKVVATGVAPAYVAAAALGDSFSNDGNTMLHVKNGGGAPITVTINAVSPCNHGFEHDIAVVVTNAQERLIGPFPIVRFGRTVSVSYSAVTSVTVAALQMSA